MWFSAFFRRLRTIAPAVLAILASSRIGAAETPPTATRVVNFRTTRAEATLEWLAITERGDESWRPICYGTCRVDLPPGLVLRVAGPRLRASSRFSLPAGEGAFEIQATPRLEAPWAGGIILTSVGATTATIGLLKFEFAPLCSVDSDPPDTTCAEEGRRTGTILMVLGTVALAAGVIMIVVNQTKVELSENSQEPAMRLTRGLSLTPRGLVF
jgi:hypothetical protein